MFGFNEVATFKDTLRQLAIKTFFLNQKQTMYYVCLEYN